MSLKGVIQVLRELGLSSREAEIYVALSRKGTAGVSSIASDLKIDRVQTYRALRNLQEKGVVEATLEPITRYSVVPFETLIDSLIESRKSQIAEIETDKNELMSYWKSLGAKASEYPLAKFQNLPEHKRIHKEILHMAEKSEKEILELTTSSNVIREDISGIYDAFMNSARKNHNVKFRILADISKENYAIIEKMIKSISNENLNIKWRHIGGVAKPFPEFLIKDEEEAILYVTPRDEISLHTLKATGLRVSSKIFVSTLREIFMEMWHNAIDAKYRIRELKTGIPHEQTIVIKNAQEAQVKLKEVLDASKKDVIMTTSSMGINRIAEDGLFHNYMNNKFRFKIMAPIDLDNYEAAKKLSKLCELRHIPISYLMMMIIDNEHLFMFETPLQDKELAEPTFALDNLFYTNDARYVEKVSDILNDIWKRGSDFKGEIFESTDKILKIRVSSSDFVSKIVDNMLNNQVHSVIVTENNNPVGIINERDILEKILKKRKDPEKTRGREIMTTPILTIESDEPLAKALNTMRETGLKRAAIVKNGKLVGILT